MGSNLWQKIDLIPAEIKMDDREKVYNLAPREPYAGQSRAFCPGSFPLLARRNAFRLRTRKRYEVESRREQ